MLFSTATQLSKQPEEVQAAALLITIGEEARKAYDTFKFTTDEERNSVEVLIQKFEEYYKPARNLTFQEFRFGSRDQKEGEPFNEWLTELRILAKNCEFGELEDRMLRSRIILGVRDKSLQRKLLVENPTYEKTVELCRLQEQGQEKFRESTGTAQGAVRQLLMLLLRKRVPALGAAILLTAAKPVQQKEKRARNVEGLITLLKCAKRLYFNKARINRRTTRSAHRK